MAHVDSRTGELVLRVVYDGPPGAGKTTNVLRLHERLLALREGAFVSPESRGRSTEYFDARDFVGGHVEGLRLRCQVLSVPGQVERQRRRRYLLDLADAVVFVVDPDASRRDENRAMIRSLSAWLAERGTPLLVQVNKLDTVAGDVLATIAGELRLDPSIPTIGARASEGVGVAETFLAASRLASEHVRAALARGAIETGERPVSPDDLLSALRGVDERALS